MSVSTLGFQFVETKLFTLYAICFCVPPLCFQYLTVVLHGETIKCEDNRVAYLPWKRQQEVLLVEEVIFHLSSVCSTQRLLRMKVMFSLLENWLTKSLQAPAVYNTHSDK